MSTNSTTRAGCYSHDVVPKEGLEPSRLSAPNFESGASTSSATWARQQNSEAIRVENFSLAADDTTTLFGAHGRTRTDTPFGA